MMYKINYKNTTFGDEYVEYISTPVRKEDIHDYVHNNIHKYCGNHVIGHGKYELSLEYYNGYPLEYLKEKESKLRSRISILKKELESLDDKLGELRHCQVGKHIDAEDFKLYGGGLPSKESVIKDYCDGDEELFNEEYLKYYK